MIDLYRMMMGSTSDTPGERQGGKQETDSGQSAAAPYPGRNPSPERLYQQQRRYRTQRKSGHTECTAERASERCRRDQHQVHKTAGQQPVQNTGEQTCRSSGSGTEPTRRAAE